MAGAAGILVWVYEPNILFTTGGLSRPASDRLWCKGPQNKVISATALLFFGDRYNQIVHIFSEIFTARCQSVCVVFGDGNLNPRTIEEHVATALHRQKVHRIYFIYMWNERKARAFFIGTGAVVLR
jgi:hypothetical protein